MIRGKYHANIIKFNFSNANYKLSVIWCQWKPGHLSFSLTGDLAFATD